MVYYSCPLWCAIAGRPAHEERAAEKGPGAEIGCTVLTWPAVRSGSLLHHPPSRHDELTRRIRGSGRQFNVLLHNLTSRIRGEGIKPDGGKGRRGGEKGRGGGGGGGGRGVFSPSSPNSPLYSPIPPSPPFPFLFSCTDRSCFFFLVPGFVFVEI